MSPFVCTGYQSALLSLALLRKLRRAAVLIVLIDAIDVATDRDEHADRQR